jgi:hypothetical protein
MPRFDASIKLNDKVENRTVAFSFYILQHLPLFLNDQCMSMRNCFPIATSRPLLVLVIRSPPLGRQRLKEKRGTHLFLGFSKSLILVIRDCPNLRRQQHPKAVRATHKIVWLVGNSLALDAGHQTRMHPQLELFIVVGGSGSGGKVGGWRIGMAIGHGRVCFRVGSVLGDDHAVLGGGVGSVVDDVGHCKSLVVMIVSERCCESDQKVLARLYNRTTNV